MIVKNILVSTVGETGGWWASPASFLRSWEIWSPYSKGLRVLVLRGEGISYHSVGEPLGRELSSRVLGHPVWLQSSPLDGLNLLAYVSVGENPRPLVSLRLCLCLALLVNNT